MTGFRNISNRLLIQILICAFGLATVGVSPLAWAQVTDPGTKQQLSDAAQKGFPVQASLNVVGSVSVEAVLLPERVCREVFGKEISQNYAAIEITVSNRSSEAGLIVHSLFMNYHDWALSGALDKGSSRSTSPDSLQSWQAATAKDQISSVEYRIARGQLLDRQPWTARNIVIRSLQLAGSITSAYVFTTTNVDVIRGVGAFTGHVIPAAQTFWPDGTIGQMNRISDVGFQVNKVIPKDSSDIIVAFFPIDRFLTPGLKKLFLKSPALFFAPSALVLDPDVRKELVPLIAPMFESKGEAQTYLGKLAGRVISKTAAGPQDTNILAFLNAVSLNAVQVVVGGTMTVDVNTVPATIVSVELDGGNDKMSNWTQGAHTGVIFGRYLLAGVPELVSAPPGVTISPVQDGSTDSQLHFTLALPDGFTAGPKTLSIRVSKKDSNNRDVQSMTYQLVVPSTGGASEPQSVQPAKH